MTDVNINILYIINKSIADQISGMEINPTIVK